MRKKIRGLLSLFLALPLVLPPSIAWAHSGQRGFILLLPTHLYLIGGALVVALSFAVMALVPATALPKLDRAQWRLGRPPRSGFLARPPRPARA